MEIIKEKKRIYSLGKLYLKIRDNWNKRLIFSIKDISVKDCKKLVFDIS